MVNRLMTVHVERTRNYGRISQTFGISEQFNITPDFTYMAAYNRLLTIVDEFFADYEANVLPGTQFETAGQPAPSNVAIFTCHELVRKQDGDKVSYALKTKESKYAKFGAGIYEALESYPKLKAIVDQKGKAVFTTEMKCKIDMSGKTPRVIEIIGAT